MGGRIASEQVAGLDRNQWQDWVGIRMASIGDAKTFDNGRQMAAWLGLVPRQHSSGGKPTLLG